MVKNSYPADTAQLPQMLTFVEAALEKAGCPMGVSMQLCIALEELFVNVCRYGYPESKGSVEVTVLPKQGGVTFLLEDYGIPFDPLARDQADTQAMADSEQIGGLGIHMVKKIVDRLDYSYENGKNKVTVEKWW